MSDSELLTEYARHRSQDAFTGLVERVLLVHISVMVSAFATISSILSVGALGVLHAPSKATISAPTPHALATTSPTNFDQQRDMTARIKCAGNMVQIGQAMLLYANDHKGHFPGDFGSLIIIEGISPQLFVCPDSKTPIPSDLFNQSLEAQAIWVDQHSDYIYIGNGQKTGSPDNILVYEKDSNHIDAMNMLYADGHVEINHLSWAHQAIQKQLAAKK